MNLEKPMKAREAAELLGVHVNTLKRIPPADLPFVRVARRGDRRYYPSDLKTYLYNNTAKRETRS